MQYIDVLQRIREKNDVLENIAATTVDNGGGTYQHKTGAPVTLRDGYVVGVANIAEVCIADLAGPNRRDSVADIRTYLWGVWPETLPKSAQYVGTWISDGVLYVDAVTVYRDREQALAAARRNGERAIYDVANGRDIRADYGQA